MNTATAMQRSQVRPINVVETMRFRTIRPIERTSLPVGRSHNRATIRNLEVVREFNSLLDEVCKKGLNPCEIVGELDVSGPDVEAERQKRKSFAQTFRKLLRASVKEHGLAKQIEVVEFDKGARFFVVGRAA